MASSAQFSRHESLGLILLNHPPVNALSASLREDVYTLVSDAIIDSDVSVLAIAGRGRGFCAGADIAEFSMPHEPSAPTLRDIISLIEDSPKPVVAVIHGFALGGGLELALGCHYRVGTKAAKLGQPEIKLGMVPGAGATQRLPRLIGLEPALDAILGGEPLSGQASWSLGLLDELFEGDVVEGALGFAQRAIAGDLPIRKTREIDHRLDEPADPADILAQARASAARKARGMIAPQLCIDSVENGLKMSFDEAMAEERALFIRTRDSEQAQALRHLFFSERRSREIPDIPSNLEFTQVASASVIGCGTMGAGIAMTFASAGIPVRVLEATSDRLVQGLNSIQISYQTAVSRGRLTEAEATDRLSLISGTLEYSDVSKDDIVIEAVFEDMELKKEVFRRLDRVCSPDVILATNTSGLDVDEIATSTAHPERVIGTHFFSPANVMRLMEIVRGRLTSRETVAAVMQLSKQLGKVGVQVGVGDGFVGNRMLWAYVTQANRLLEEGALPDQIDRVMFEFGFPMGPFAMGDLAGLDVGWRIRQERARRHAHRQYSWPIADRICEQGRLGQKSGAGWYRYSEGSRTPIPDPEVELLIVEVSKELGIIRRDIGDEEILERCLFPLINEGATILEEGLALRSGDIDVIWIHGYGFPSYRGGPMFYADQIGLNHVESTVRRLSESKPDVREPAPLLQRLAASGEAFTNVRGGP